MTWAKRQCHRDCVYLVFAVVMMTSSPQVDCLGVFELRLLSFQSDLDVPFNSSCCNTTGSSIQQESPTTMQICRRTPCRVFFRICLSHYQANIPQDPQCTYGLMVTPTLPLNILSPSNISNGTGYLTSFEFNFTWTGSFSLIIEVFHNQTTPGSSNEGNPKLITRMTISKLLNVSGNWTQETYTNSTTSSNFVYEYRAICQKTYYGPGCINVCVPRDDLFGHYDCDVNGQKVCKTGWTGPYCQTAECLDGCNTTYGSCNSPFECKCKYGWGGEFCDECLIYPGCVHGYCIQPWQCVCNDGWRGTLCNIDMNYCSEYNPCLNGGRCVNDGSSNYTCICLPGYDGRNCDFNNTAGSCLQTPCLNQGTCQMLNGNYVCLCPGGYAGVRCEIDSPDTVTQFTNGSSLDPTVPLFPKEPSTLTLLQIILIVCLGGLLPVIIAVVIGVVCAVVRRKRRRSAQKSGPTAAESGPRSSANTKTSLPSSVQFYPPLPKLNNTENNNRNTEISDQLNILDAKKLSQYPKILNVNLNTNHWSDQTAEEPEVIWTKRKDQTKSPHGYPHIIGRDQYSSANISDIFNANNIHQKPTEAPNFPRKQRSKPAVKCDFVSVVTWHCEYPVEILSTDV